MIEVGRHSESLGQYIRCGEVYTYGIAAACGLCVVAFDTAYECLIVLERAFGVKSQVVAYTGARALHLEHSIESYDFVACADSDGPLCCFDELPGRCVEGECALIAVFGVELQIVFQSGVDAEERCESFGDGYRRYIIW